MSEVNIKVRYNPEAEQIEVVAESGSEEQVIGYVERDIWSQWPLVPEPVVEQPNEEESAEEVTEDSHED